MNRDFPRILVLLRKEKSISQKEAAASMGISQALLSHYEKGIRECGLEFLVRCADFYGVSCDYLLGRSADRTGLILTVDELPAGENEREDRQAHGSLLPVLGKKLLVNSLLVLYSLLEKAGSRQLTAEVSDYLMLAIYRMFRVLYQTGEKNPQSLFAVAPQLCEGYADGAMHAAAARAGAIARGQSIDTETELHAPKPLALSQQTLVEQYPLYATSLLNLVRNAENRAQPKP